MVVEPYSRFPCFTTGAFVGSFVRSFHRVYPRLRHTTRRVSISDRRRAFGSVRRVDV